MTSESTAPYKSPKRRYLILLSVIAVVIVGWTAAWFYGRSVLREQLDLHLAQLSDRGTKVECSELQIAGFPFRYEIYCQSMNAQERIGASGKVSGLAAVAMIYNPGHIILEAEAPASWTMPVDGTSGELTWQTARASMKVGTNGLGKLDVVIEKPRAFVRNGLAEVAVSSEKAAFHLRPVPDQENGVDGFLKLDAFGAESVPELSADLDVRIHVRLEHGKPLLSGVGLADLVIGHGEPLPVRLELAEVSSGSSRFGASGDLFLNGNGTLSGKVDLTLTNAEEAVALIRPLFAKDDQGFAIAEGLITSLQPTATDHTGEAAIKLPLIIDQGLIRIGFATLGVIPPLFQAGI